MKRLAGFLIAFSLSLLWASTAMAVPMGSYLEGWDANTSGGWTSNTISSSVQLVSSGGNPDGYILSSRIPVNTFDIGIRTVNPELSISPGLDGDYSATPWIASLDLLLLTEDVTDAWVRFRGGTDPVNGFGAGNGWVFALPISLSQTTWQSFSAFLDPLWTDAEAKAAGWVPMSDITPTNPSDTWANTLSDVWSVEVRISSTNSNTKVGVDNFALTPIPEPGTMLLISSGLVGLAGFGRRRKK